MLLANLVLSSKAASPGGARDVAGVGTTASARFGRLDAFGSSSTWKACQRAAWELAAPEAQTRRRTPVEVSLTFPVALMATRAGASG